MTDLHQKNCIPCRGGIPPFDISEMDGMLKKIMKHTISLKKILSLRILQKAKSL